MLHLALRLLPAVEAGWGLAHGLCSGCSDSTSCLSLVLQGLCGFQSRLSMKVNIA